MFKYFSYEFSSFFIMFSIFIMFIYQDIQLVFSFFINLFSVINKNIFDFIDIMIIKIKNDIQKINNFIKFKINFKINKFDILIIKNMNIKNHDILSISWNLSKHLSHEMREFLKKKK